MKLACLIISTVSAFGGMIGGGGGRPPAYLSIQGWQDCVGSKDMGSWQAVCVPVEKPADCTAAAFTLLGASASGLEEC